MADFATWRAFHRFSESVSRRARYIREPEAEEFLAIVLQHAVARAVPLPVGTPLWRAQLGKAERDHGVAPGPVPYPSDRMKPRRGRATEGRLNPKGIPVLYLAKSEETAMAEVRPWKGSFISLAEFRVLRDLTIVDFSTEDLPLQVYYKTEPEGPERDAAVWAYLDNAFSKPTLRSDDGSEYVATQVISDALRSAGYDGIEYTSGLVKGGRNVVLFDPASADPINCRVHMTTGVTFKFKIVSDRRDYQAQLGGEPDSASPDAG